MWETLKEWDNQLFIFLNSLGSEPYDSFWIFATQIESWAAIFVYFLVLILYFYGSRKGIVVILCTIFTFTLAFTITHLTKEYFGRLRPNNVEALSPLIRVLQEPSSYSFFSGHAASSFSITTFVVLALRGFNKWIYLAYLWPLIFVSSRVYVGVHYPADIIAGSAIGIFIAYISYRICSKILQKI